MKTFTQYIKEVKKPTGDLKKACWTGYTAVGTKEKGGRTVPNCVPEEVQHIDELSKETLSSYSQKAKDDADKFHNMAVKHSTDGKLDRGLMKMVGKRSIGSQKAKQKITQEAKDHEYSDPHMAVNQLKTIMHNAEEMINLLGDNTDLPEWVESKITLAEDYIMTVANYMRSEMHEEHNPENMFDVVEDYVMQIAEMNEVDPEVIWEDLEVVTDEELYETAAWQRKEGKRASGGLNQKGVDSYRREHPGSKLKTAVTTKPSKLKKGSKAAKRRKSFCARMGGMKKRLTSAKTSRDPNSRINKALRKWNC